jgi:hypothetical protein
MKPSRPLLIFLAAAALGACIPYPPELLPDEGAKGNSQYTLTSGGYTGLDAPFGEIVGLRFKVHAYGSTLPQEISDASEQSFARLMTDTGLTSFQPRGLYEIDVYGSQDEYRKKTGQPDWSTGVVVGNTIYTYYSSVLNGVLAHEMTHLFWLEYMNGRLSDQQRWVNEGLAVYEEMQSRAGGSQLFGGLLPMLRTVPLPPDQLQNMAPGTERAYDSSLWYAESGSLIRFMIERGGRIGFGQFLASIQQGQTFDNAIYAAFPGQWQTLEIFYNAWKGSLQ